MRKQATPAAQGLARWLLRQEAGEDPSGRAGEQTASYIVERLRLSLVKLIGVAGFQALFARALALAKAEVGWLEAVRVRPDGTLEGFDEAAKQQDAAGAAQGGTALLAHLIGLLILFIGEDLTLRLVRDIWPDALLNELKSGAEENPE